MASDFTAFQRWLECVITDNPHMKKFTMPIWVVELPCGCKRARPLPMDGNSAVGMFRDTRWRVLRKENAFYHAVCRKLLLELPARAEKERLPSRQDSIGVLCFSYRNRKHKTGGFSNPPVAPSYYLFAG